MNPQLKQSWISALRSGHYAQGRGLLRQRSSSGKAYFCAMGVLFDLIATPNQWDRLTRPASQVGMIDEVLGYIPPEMLGEIGISGMQQGLIASLNDSGKTFNLIADVIEETFEDEFQFRDTVSHLTTGVFDVDTKKSVTKLQRPPDWNALAIAKLMTPSPTTSLHDGVTE